MFLSGFLFFGRVKVAFFADEFLEVMFDAGEFLFHVGKEIFGLGFGFGAPVDFVGGI